MRGAFFDWEGRKCDASVSSSCVLPAVGSRGSPGGGEPEDSVVGNVEPDSGGEFIAMVAVETSFPHTHWRIVRELILNECATGKGGCGGVLRLPP